MRSIQTLRSEVIMKTAFILFVLGWGLGSPACQDMAEPSFEGESLSQWLDMLKFRPGKHFPQRTSYFIADAFRSMMKKDPDVVLRLVPVLQSKQYLESVRASWVLENLGAKAKRALPEIVKGLESPDEHVRRNSARLFFALGMSAKEAEPLLLQLVEREKEDYNRMYGFIYLANYGSEAKAAGPKLIKYLHDSNLTIRREAVECVAAIQASQPEVLANLKTAMRDRDRGIQLPCAITLRKLTQDLDALETLRQKAPFKLESDPLLGVSFLKELGDDAPLLKQVFVDMIGDKTRKRGRDAAVFALGQVAHGQPDALSVLLQALEDDDPKVQTLAASALGKWGKAARPAIPQLLKMLQKPRVPQQANAAARALGHIGLDSEGVVPALITLLETEPATASDRGTLLKAVGDFGPRAKAAIPTLLTRARQVERGEGLTELRVDFARALWRIDRHPQAIEMFRAEVTSLGVPNRGEEYSPSHGLLAGLGELGPAALPFVPRLERYRVHLTDEEAILVDESLWRINPTPATQDRFRVVLLHEYWIVRVHALEALGRLGPLAKPLLSEVKKALTDRHPRVRAAAAAALKAIESETSPKSVKPPLR